MPTVSGLPCERFCKLWGNATSRWVPAFVYIWSPSWLCWPEKEMGVLTCANQPRFSHTNKLDLSLSVVSNPGVHNAWLSIQNCACGAACRSASAAGDMSEAEEREPLGRYLGLYAPAGRIYQHAAGTFCKYLLCVCLSCCGTTLPHIKPLSFSCTRGSPTDWFKTRTNPASYSKTQPFAKPSLSPSQHPPSASSSRTPSAPPTFPLPPQALRCP